MTGSQPVQFEFQFEFHPDREGVPPRVPLCLSRGFRLYMHRAAVVWAHHRTCREPIVVWIFRFNEGVRLPELVERLAGATPNARSQSSYLWL